MNYFFLSAKNKLCLKMKSEAGWVKYFIHCTVGFISKHIKLGAIMWKLLK